MFSRFGAFSADYILAWIVSRKSTLLAETHVFIQLRLALNLILINRILRLIFNDAWKSNFLRVARVQAAALFFAFAAKNSALQCYIITPLFTSSQYRKIEKI